MLKFNMVFSDFQKGFYVVSEELFQGQVSWGRIVSLFAYGVRLAQHCVENNKSNMVIDVVSSLSYVAVDKLTPFLRDHGGWVRILIFFRDFCMTNETLALSICPGKKFFVLDKIRFVLDKIILSMTKYFLSMTKILYTA